VSKTSPRLSDCLSFNLKVQNVPKTSRRVAMIRRNRIHAQNCSLSVVDSAGQN
jgi:hypothetical protein